MPTYKITTQEPLENWCKPKHEGDTMEVVEYDDDFPDDPSEAVTRRYIAVAEVIDWRVGTRDLSWVPLGAAPIEVPIHKPKPKTARKKQP